jgi:O-antigen/teichoic acid export membrane protein
VRPLLRSNSDPARLIDYHDRLTRSIHHLYPNALFTCLQGQVATWLFTLFATSTQVADFGALNRFGIVFTIISSPISQWLTPTFARTTSRARLVSLALSTSGLVASLGTIFGLLVWQFPEPFLQLLGPKYSHLNTELLWLVGLMTSTSLMQTLWGLNMARGWVRTLSWNIPLVLVIQALLIWIIPANTIAGVALISICVALAQCAHASLVTLSGIRSFHPIPLHPV